jgi:hypothetical protein
MLKTLFLQHRMFVAGARDFGMIVPCVKHAKAAVWRTHIGSPAFTPWRACRDSLVTRSTTNALWRQ